MAERSIFMKTFLFFTGITLALAGHAAPDKNSLLFYKLISGPELDIALGLGYTTVVLSDVEWNQLTAADVSTYKAVILGDPDVTDASPLAIPVMNRDVWSPAILGNIIIIGTDPASHDGLGTGADQLMKSAIKFAADDQKTGLYLALSEYYGYVDDTTVTILDRFGEFRVRGNLDCYNKAHMVANSPALAGLTDALLSNWGCSVHELFLKFPDGAGEFVPLAIAQDFKDTAFGIRTFSDGSSGLPYIISRGAPPIKCGDGVLDPGEECDDHNTVNGDGCAYNCMHETPGGGTTPTGPTKGCNLCDATVGLNKCDITTGCSNTPYGTMCACRPGYRAAVPGDNIDQHWRLQWSIPGHEHRVYVKPGVVCDTLCDNWQLGAAGCAEVSIGMCSMPVGGGGGTLPACK